jgi:integrase/recombinase XerD
MKLSKAIEGFELSRLADGYAPVTLRGYRSSLGLLARYLEDPEVEKITSENLKAFMHHLRADYRPERPSGNVEPLATASHHRYWKAIRSFFKWAAEDLKTGRPDLELKMPQFTTREIVPFSHEEIARLLKACENSLPVVGTKRRAYQCKRPTAVRDRALILVLLDTGVRAGECARLRIRDANLENGEMYVKPHHVRKTRPRTVYLGKSARKALWKYLTTREDPRPDDPLLATIDGKPMTQGSILKVIYAVGRASGVRNAHPHRFRHTFAIQFLRNGGDVFTLQRLMGHATLEMVRHYLALADADSAEAHRKSTPVDRWSF